MQSPSTSTRGRPVRRSRRLLAAIAAAGLLLPAAASAFEIIEDEIVSVDAETTEAPEVEAPEAKTADAAVVDPAPPETDVLNEAVPGAVELETVAYDLYLAIFINGLSRHVVVAVHREADGSLWMLPADLAEAGIAAPKDQPPDQRVALAALTDVTYVFDEAQQSIDFTAAESARARLIIDANGDDAADAIVAADTDTRTGDFGIVLNYDLFASASVDDKGVVMSPLSGAFEARAYGPFGLVEQTFALLSDPLEFRRLNTTWSLSDPNAMRTYRAGDIVTGALSWTRPTRLGGVQVQNDFGLRSDFITYPVPSITGTAALPSAVDIYVNDSNRYSGEVPEGPFEIVDVPVLTGAGTIELVVEDAAGNKVSTKADYFSSPRLLRPGLVDYSAEVGVARTHFGTAQDRYDDRLMASASIRTGVTDWLTWEGHAEGGLELINAGTGVTMALGRLGLGQFSVAGSKTPDSTGVQLAGSLQMSFGRVNVSARAQKSFGRYEDIASFTAPGVTDPTEPTPSSLYQLSLSLPTPFEGGRANLSYTQLERSTGETAQLLAASYGQKIFAGTGSATAYTDLSTGRYGMTMSLWMPLGNDLSTRASVRHTDEGTALMADIGNGGGNEIGDVNWLLRVNQHDRTEFSAMARTKLPVASVRTRVVHRNGSTNASAQLSGSVIAADGGLHLTNPVSDAFAVVDVGAPGIPVLYQNRVIGVTGNDGKLVVPGLAAYDKNRISIDPTNLPLDSVIDNTTAVVIPARGAGVTVTFGSKTEGGTALVSFVDESGAYLPLASTGSAGAGLPEFVVGYDGAALLEGLAAENIVTITLPDGSACIADVPYADAGGALVDIPDVVCHRA
jgi:outer membrane usher protein